MCDWDGDGASTPGVVRWSTWYLRDSNTTGVAETTFTYGIAGDSPRVSDWGITVGSGARGDTPRRLSVAHANSK